MGLLQLCPCNNSTSVYQFKLNGTSAITVYHWLLRHSAGTASTIIIQEGNLTFSVCTNNCCQLCDNRNDEGDSNNETNLELPMMISMAAFIALLLVLLVMIPLLYWW